MAGSTVEAVRDVMKALSRASGLTPGEFIDRLRANGFNVAAFKKGVDDEPQVRIERWPRTAGGESQCPPS